MRAFKSIYGITLTQYRDKFVGLENFEKLDLLLNYIMIDEGVPLISDGFVLEISRKTLEETVSFLVGVCLLREKKNAWRKN